MLGKSFVDRAQFGDDRPVVHKRRARPAHLRKGIYDSHHHAKRYRDREPARAIATSGTISRALAERIFLDIKVSVAQK